MLFSHRQTVRIIAEQAWEQELEMFGYQGGESPEVVSEKRKLMKSSQEKWPFLTKFDCSTIKTKGQLISIVNIRSRVSHDQARRDVDAWLKHNAG